MNGFRECFRLFAVFFQFGAFTFGGGLAMLPVLERELVRKLGWMTASELVDYYAIGQVTPGIIAVNVATFVGHKRRGIPGAVFATAGMVTPSVIVITLLAMFLDSFSDVEVVQRALRGINVVVACLLVSAVWNVGKRTVFDWVTASVAVASFAVIVFLDAPAIAVVVSSAILGLLVRFRDWRRPGRRTPRDAAKD
jgi:chromate transporter